MGKFGGVVSVLHESGEIPTEDIDWLIRTMGKYKKAYNDVEKIDPKEYGLDNLKTWQLRTEKVFNAAMPLLSANFPGTKGKWTHMATIERYVRLFTAVGVYQTMPQLNLNSPFERKLLIANIDEAIRSTQFMYRPGLDQGILSSSPIAQMLFVRFVHYSISKLATGAYYFNNMLRQASYYGYKGLFTFPFMEMYDNDTDNATYGKQAFKTRMTIARGTPHERTFDFPERRYARIVFRMVMIGMLIAMLDKPFNMLLDHLQYSISNEGVTGILYALGILVNIGIVGSYQDPFSYVVWELITYFTRMQLGATYGHEKDDKLQRKIRQALWKTREDYKRDMELNPKTSKFVDKVSDEILNNQYTVNMINEFSRQVPMGSQQAVFMQAVVQFLVTSSFLPENYLELGYSAISQVLPIRYLRSPLLQPLGTKYAYPLEIGYNPLHTKLIKYKIEQEQNKKDDGDENIKLKLKTKKLKLRP
jgi:hypothetical protein